MKHNTTTGVKPYFDIMKRETREMCWRLINSWKYHCVGTGFNEWKINTPPYVKELQQKLFNNPF